MPAFGLVNIIPSFINLFRSRDLPIFFSTKDFERSQQSGNATHRPRNRPKSEDYEIYPAIDFRATDELVKKLKASVFFKTELHDHLKRLDVDSLFIVGESTSGCVRASVVESFSLGYQVCVIENCVFDQNPVSHAVNLYDIQHKYGQVVKLSNLH